MENNFFFSPALEQAIEQVIIEYPAHDAEDIKQKLIKLQIYNVELIKDYCERINIYQRFVNDLLKRLEEEEIIIMSRQKYYSLVNSRTKGYDGEIKAFKYIFDNYIENTFEYNALPESIKKEYKGYKTIRTGTSLELTEWVVSKIIKYI